MGEFDGDENARALVTWYLTHPDVTTDWEAMVEFLEQFSDEEKRDMLAWFVGFTKGLMARASGREGEALVEFWRKAILRQEADNAG